MDNKSKSGMRTVFSVIILSLFLGGVVGSTFISSILIGSWLIFVASQGLKQGVTEPALLNLIFGVGVTFVVSAFATDVYASSFIGASGMAITLFLMGPNKEETDVEN